MYLEKCGIPTSTIVTTGFHKSARLEAQALGAPALPLVVIPHPVAHLAVKDVRELAEAAFESIVTSLSGKQGEAAPDYSVNYVLPHERQKQDEECSSGCDVLPGNRLSGKQDAIHTA
ncbi:MAG TPA: hypothetical protein DCZ97_04855 [Syntrophus sp. (in: bacteria)]|nr:hypothetical protein [Syntrophus sp. (in: bacteria)]